MKTTTIRLSAYAESELEIRSTLIDEDEDGPNIAAALRAYDWRRGVLVVPHDKAETIWRGLTELANICDALAEDRSISPDERRANRHACRGLTTAAQKAIRLTACPGRG